MKSKHQAHRVKLRRTRDVIAEMLERRLDERAFEIFLAKLDIDHCDPSMSLLTPLGSARSGQTVCQVEGNISIRVTAPPEAFSIGIPKRIGIGRLPSAQRLTSGGYAPMARLRRVSRPRSRERYVFRSMRQV